MNKLKNTKRRNIMNKKEILTKKLASLAVRVGANVQKNQIVVIT